ncbi:MAG: LptF/LptG family permease [Spirochaetaceae bacterium]|jgi:lipopolysaccharide export system permease protein|nr:LptF/LptG family permease [Spirochaetaceae bacterium]
MTLDRHLLKQFFPVFLFSLILFVMLVSLIDLFYYLVRYLNANAAIKDILRVSLYYVPKSLSYAMPVSLLFSSAYTLGDLSARNELITVIGSGMPFWRFCRPLIILGIAASVFAFFFEDLAVIPTLRKKNEISKELLHINTDTLADIVIKLKEGRIIYSADYYTHTTETLNGVTIIELDDTKRIVSIVYAPQAIWTGASWSFSNALIYRWEKGFFKPREYKETGEYTEDPQTFVRSSVPPEDLQSASLRLLIQDLKKAGLPAASALTDYYHRFSFSAVSFVIIFLSLSMSTQFKQNTLLLSLLGSLGTAVIYYVVEMISMMSARVGLLPPFLGAWIPVFICTAAGLLLLWYSRT